MVGPKRRCGGGASLGVSGSVALLGACGPGAPPPAAPPAASGSPPPVVAAPSPAPVPEYALAPSVVARHALAPRGPGDDGGALVDGERYTVAGAVAEAGGQPLRLEGGVRVPSRLGGGFWFWSGGELLRAGSFAGALTPLTTLAFRPARVSFGPRLALVVAPGERALLDPATGQLAPIDPPALADWAVADDGTAVAVLHGGGVLVSRGGGAWADVSAEVREAPSQVRAIDGAAWVTLPTGPALRFDARGHERFASAPAAAPPARPPGWTHADAPLERALRAGAELGERAAVVEASGSIARVDLVTGDVTSMSERVLPAGATCTAVRTPTDILFVCEAGRASIVVAGGAGQRPRLEKSFPGTGPFAVSAGGALLREGACNGELTLPRLCVRSTDGAWRELDVSSAVERGDAGASSSRVQRWVPADDGHAIGVVTGDEPGLFDTRTGKHRAIAPATFRAALDATGPRSVTAGGLDRAWTARADGALVGWSGDRAVTIAPDGMRVDGPFQLALVWPVGPRALGQDSEGHLFQTLDHGQSWREVLAPADLPRLWRGAVACSDAGCHLGRWLRPGWRPTAPAPPSSAPPPPRPPRVAADVARPVVDCHELGPMTRRHAPPATETEGPGFGATTVKLRTGDLAHSRERGPWAVVSAGAGTSAIPGLRALRHGKDVLLDDSDGGLGPGAGATPRTAVWADAFTPGGAAESATLRFADLVIAAHASGMPLPPTSPGDESELAVVPVLGTSPSPAAGFVLEGNGPAVWLRTPRPAALPIALPGAADDALTVGAARLDERRLALLRVDGSGRAEVLVVDGGRAFRRLVIPGPPGADTLPSDALGVAPGGALAVLRLPRTWAPPSADDPALLLAAGSPPAPLAPWSTLTPASAPECGDPAGSWRAIVQVPLAWVDVRGTLAPAERHPMAAVVRWSRERVCLEALELVLDPVAVNDAAVQPWVVATFGARPRAAVAGRELGVEVHQEVECALAPGTPPRAP